MSLFSQGDMRNNSHYGYGKSFIKIQDSIRQYRYNNEIMTVEWNSPRSKVQLYYGPDPIETAHHLGQYRIHMSQHESTAVVPHKARAYINDCEEVWTANPWGANAMINSGVPESKIFIYEHGLSPEEFVPVLRGFNKKIRFLHIDSGSPRKRSDLVEKAFLKLYPKYKNIELTLKHSHGKLSKHNWDSEKVLEEAGEWEKPGIRYIRETLTPEDMINLINFHDVLVYPSEGEGFGMIPLEVMATGMPVISTHEWASYNKFFIENSITSEIKESKIDWGYPKIGKAVIADFDSIIFQMENAINNIDSIALKYFNQVEDIKKEYSWEKKTKDAIDGLISRVGVEMFEKTQLRKS